MNETLGIQPILDHVLSSAIVGGVLLFGLCAVIVIGLMWYDARTAQRRFEVGRNAAMRRLLQNDERGAGNNARGFLGGSTWRRP